MSQPILQTIDLFKHFGGLAVNRECNLTVETGEVHALIGPNGAGKTTMIAQIAGMLKPDGGRILFEGHDITGVSVHERVRRGLARTFQLTSIFPQQSVVENLALSVQARSGSSFRFWHPIRNEQMLHKEAAVLAQEVGLGDRLTTIASNLSYGEQRQLEVGLALACNAKLLLLDEPMAGVGLEESEQLIDLIRRANQRATVLLVEHDMDAVFKLADRISVLVYGILIATGTPDEIRNDPTVKEAYLGEEVTNG